MIVYKVGDVVVEKVDQDICDAFKGLEYRSAFIRREMGIIERERASWWERLESRYNLDHDSFIHNFNWETGEISIQDKRRKDEPNKQHKNNPAMENREG